MLIVDISMLCKYWTRDSVHDQTSSCIGSSYYRLCCWQATWQHSCSTFKLLNTCTCWQLVALSGNAPTSNNVNNPFRTSLFLEPYGSFTLNGQLCCEKGILVGWKSRLDSPCLAKKIITWLWAYLSLYFSQTNAGKCESVGNSEEEEANALRILQA